VKEVLIVCNPASAGGRTGRRWPEVAGGLRDGGLDLDFVMTTCAGEAVELARGGVAEGRRPVVAAGRVGPVNQLGDGVLGAAGAEVMLGVGRGRKVVSGEITIQLASIAALLRWRNKPMTTVIEGVRREAVTQQVVVANCQYFGGGMKVAPRALPDDGLLDVVVVGDVGLVENARGMRRFRDGTYLDEQNPKVSFARARRVEVSSPELVRIE